jgi:hypothetical protein
MLHLADAADRALARAGLTRADIDGICTYPGKADNSPGMSPLGTGEVRNALGLQTLARGGARWSGADGPDHGRGDGSDDRAGPACALLPRAD